MTTQIKTAILVSGTEIPLGIGVTGASRAIAKVDGEPPFPVIVKRLSLQAVFAECFAALLLRAWNLPVPEPYLITDANQLLFGSREAEYPNLMQRIGFGDELPDELKIHLTKVAASIVSNLPETPLALVVDEAIDNRDRNFGNILWDGENAAFIDHERAFGLTADTDANKLAQMALVAGDAEKIERAAVTLALTISEDLVFSVAADAGVDAQAYAEYVATRIKTLAPRVLARFPKPVDLLTPQQ